MRIERTSLPGVLVYTQENYEDNRGSFKEAVNKHHGFDLKQINVSVSRKGVVRGLHTQPNTSKLVWVVKGRIYDTAYDLSTHKGIGVELSADNNKQLFIPAGMYHGFQALEDDTIVCYAMDNYYDPQGESGINPGLVKWPLKKHIISEKDSAA